jgi:uncharacterized membrane protein YhaH (DUF805 family)
MFEALKRYAEFNGRSRRKEYWSFILLFIILSIIATMLDASIFHGMAINGEMGVVSLILSLALIIPLLAVTVRRLHDTDRSGWWILLGLIPLLGQLVLLVLYCLDGTPGENRFGPNPKQT